MNAELKVGGEGCSNVSRSPRGPEAACDVRDGCALRAVHLQRDGAMTVDNHQCRCRSKATFRFRWQS